MMRRRETGSANIASIVQLLGGEQMPRPRFQNPTICKTPGENATWYIRPWVDIIKDGKPDRSRKTITLGAVDTMGKREAIAKKNAIMGTINRSDYVLQSKTNLGDFFEHEGQVSDAYQKPHPSSLRKPHALRNHHAADRILAG